MSNQYTGEVTIDLGGKAHTIVYDWRALGQVQTDHTKEVLDNLFSLDVLALAAILVIGLRKHHPDMTLEQVLDASPPILSIQMAVNKAFAFAYYGAEGVERMEREAVEKADQGKTKKKTK